MKFHSVLISSKAGHFSTSQRLHSERYMIRALVSIILVGIHADVQAQLQACDAKLCVPNSPSTPVNLCAKVCNTVNGQTECDSKCTCSGTSPGYMCAAICRKSKNVAACGDPLVQKCSGENLVCDVAPTLAPSESTPINKTIPIRD
jgi:hypothetical protein